MTDKKDRSYPLEKIRNIGIIAHIDAGKTTTTERILFYTGKTYKIGDIDAGTTVMDWMAQERERGITIVSAATTTFWTHSSLRSSGQEDSYRINIIDTPGHVDFTAEVERSLRVLDGGITVLDAEEGVQSQSETVWRQADKYKIPRLCFVNKMDKVGADFLLAVRSIKEKLGAATTIMELPLGVEQNFRGVVDLLTKKALIWGGDDLPTGRQDLGTKYEITDKIPQELASLVEEYRHKLIEQISETDEVLLKKYVKNQEPTILELKAALRRATISYQLVPVFCGSSLRNKGVQPLLDAVVEYLPSPLDLPPAKGTSPKTGKEEERSPDINAPFSGLAFKIQIDPHVGRLTYCRIYSGTLASGTSVFNATKNKEERISRLLLMHANHREEIKQAFAGEIVAIVGLRETSTGDTLSSREQPIILERISFPEPVISLAIEPKTKIDQEKLGLALQRLSEEDPTFRIKSNPETGQTIISGMGELQLEIMVDRMKREFGVESNIGAPQVAYKETIKGQAWAEGKYIRQSGGRGQYGHCFLRVEPVGRGEGYQFVNAIKGGAIPSEFIPAVEKGVKEAMENGVLLGYLMTDIKVTLYDGTYHEVDSSDIAFKIAGSQALQGATKQAGLTLVEPIMKVEVSTPEEFMGQIIGDISSKRGQIQGSENRGNTRIILALVPLAELSGYATALRSMSQGRASYYMEPSHYDEVPKNIQEQMLAKSTFTGRVR